MKLSLRSPRSIVAGERRAAAAAFSCIAALLIAGAGGCGGSSSGGSAAVADLPESCAAFVSSYEHCLAAVSGPAVARARAEQTRSALASEASRGGAARSGVDHDCASNLRDLRSTCK